MHSLFCGGHKNVLHHNLCRLESSVSTVKTSIAGVTQYLQLHIICHVVFTILICLCRHSDDSNFRRVLWQRLDTVSQMISYLSSSFANSVYTGQQWILQKTGHLLIGVDLLTFTSSVFSAPACKKNTQFLFSCLVFAQLLTVYSFSHMFYQYFILDNGWGLSCDIDIFAGMAGPGNPGSMREFCNYARSFYKLVMGL